MTDSAQNGRNLWMSLQRLCICVVFGACQDPLQSCHCTIAAYCKDIQTTSNTKSLKTSELRSSKMFMTGRCRALQVPAFSHFLASIIVTSKSQAQLMPLGLQPSGQTHGVANCRGLAIDFPISIDSPGLT